MLTVEQIAALHTRAAKAHGAGDDARALALLSRARGGAGGSRATAPIRAVLDHDLGRIHEDGGRYRRAIAYYRRAVAALPLEGDPTIAELRINALNRLSDMQRILGRYDAARATLLRAIAEAAVGSDARKLAAQHNDLGVIEKARGRYASAARSYQRALAIFERVHAGEHGDIATVLHNLGGLAHARRQYAAGEPFARRGVAIRERLLGTRHPVVAADRVALAALVDGQGRFEEAEALYREALDVLEASLGPDHYELAVALRNLGAIRERRGDLVAAERYFRRALAIKRGVLGHVHPEVATLVHDLALVAHRRGKPKRALELIALARELFERTVPARHPSRVRCAATEKALRKAAPP
jgi:tetratricopeptide (TPR) repeat protein